MEIPGVSFKTKILCLRYSQETYKMPAKAGRTTDGRRTRTTSRAGNFPSSLFSAYLIEIQKGGEGGLGSGGHKSY